MIPAAVLLILSFLSMAEAATFIELRDDEGTIQRMWIEGGMLRVDADEMEGYAVVDMASGRMFMVNHEERLVIEMDPALPVSPADRQAPRSKPAEIRLIKKGAGPKIAGYATEHYILTADGKTCGEEFVSRQALQDTGLQKLLRNLAVMPGLEPSGAGADPCENAEYYLEQELVTIGLPLRSIDRAGIIESEVSRIRKGAEIPEVGFDPPAGYSRMNFGDILQGMSRQ